VAKHRTFREEFEARVALQVLNDAKAASQAGLERQLGKQLLASWKKQLLAHAGHALARGRGANC
jgi:hypothetical protein